MENSQNNSNPQTRQRRNTRHILQAHSITLAQSYNARKKIILPHITNNIIIAPHQHGFRRKHSTTTALHKINNIISNGFNNITKALDFSKAFDAVNLQTLVHKLHNTNIPKTILKYIANYIKRRKQYTLYNNHISTLRNTKTGVPEGGVGTLTNTSTYILQISRHQHPQTSQQ